MDYSFYGGRRGAAFVITGRFRYISADKITQRDMKLIEEEYGDNKPIKTFSAWKLIYCMKEAFSQGGNYTVVNYDEYVIIDSFNKNDPDNGKIFRRGYSYTDELGGAQYVGQIVGPSGLAPAVKMTTYDEVLNMAEQEGYEYRHTNGEYAPTVNLVPGKKNDGTFNDSIKWACCSVRDEFNKDTTAYVGFTFPYTVIEYTAATVDPYYHRSNNTANFVNQNLVDRVDDGQHPFFKKWDIKIPKGIKGDAFKNFRVINAAASDNVQPYSGQVEDREADRKIFVYDYYHYDKDGNGEPVTIYLGDYNVIDNVTVDEEGTFTIDYSHNDDSVLTKKIKWIKSVSLNRDTGHFEVHYNHETDANGNPTKYETDLSWVNEIKLSENGTITIGYCYGDDTVLDQKIKWVTKTELSTDGVLKITYNDGSTSSMTNKIKWISSIAIDTGSTEGNGTQKLVITYNDGTSTKVGNPINYIMRTAISADHHLLVLYSDPARRADIKARGQNNVWDGRDDWFDLGSIKEDNGLLVGTHYDTTEYADMGSIDSAIEHLNTEWPSGLIGDHLDGKVATSGAKKENKYFFGFDYTYGDITTDGYKGWYYLGMFSDLNVVAGREDDAATQAIATTLPTGGIWMVTYAD